MTWSFTDSTGTHTATFEELVRDNRLTYFDQDPVIDTFHLTGTDVTETFFFGKAESTATYQARCNTINAAKWRGVLNGAVGDLTDGTTTYPDVRVRKVRLRPFSSATDEWQGTIEFIG